MKKLFAVLLALVFTCALLVHPSAARAEAGVLLEDRYPTVQPNLRVCHGSWVLGGWDKNVKNASCRLSGPFMLGDTAYVSGIGMYLESSAFRSSAAGTIGSSSVSYRLNGMYKTFRFDLGADSSDMRYCGNDDGKASIQIYSDDTMVYDSGYFDYSASYPNQTVDITGAQKLKIVLNVKRGSNNTLNVVLGGAALYEGAAPASSGGSANPGGAGGWEGKGILLQDRYPTVQSHLRVCHGSWVLGSWDKNNANAVCRLSGSFMLGDTTYLNGIGMYLESSAFRSSAAGTVAASSVSYRLNGMYRTFRFHLGADSSDMRYCGNDDGKACVQIYSDDTLVYDSGYFDYASFFPDQEVNITGAQKLKIVLNVKRGSNNTLNVVLADAALFE